MKYVFTIILLQSCIALKSQVKDSLLFSTGDFKIYAESALKGDSIVYDATLDYKRILEIEEEGNTDCLKGILVNYTPLSLVGDYYSYSRSRYDIGGTGDCARNPSSEVAINTLNLQTLKPASLLDLINEQSLVNAIQKDKYVRSLYGVMDTVKLDNQKTFKAVLKLIASIMGNHDSFKENQFAVHSYDKETGQLAIRLVAQEYMGYNHNKFIQLGLWVDPKIKTRELLKSEGNFFLDKFQNTLAPQ